jgi:hypothetical protein
MAAARAWIVPFRGYLPDVHMQLVDLSLVEPVHIGECSPARWVLPSLLQQLLRVMPRPVRRAPRRGRDHPPDGEPQHGPADPSGQGQPDRRGNPTIPPSATMTMLAGTGSSASPTSRPTATAAESGEDSHGTPTAFATR